MFLLKSRGRKQFFVVAREALGRIWAVAGRQGRLWAFSRSYFFKVKWILNEFLPKLDRLVLVRINEFLNFFFEFVERVFLIRSFLKKNAKIRKKEREKNLNENRDFSDQKISIFAEKNAKIFFCTISKI